MAGKAKADDTSTTVDGTEPDATPDAGDDVFAAPPAGDSLPMPGSEAHADLLAALDKGFPESWLAEAPGDTIVGAFLRVEQGQTGFGPAPIVILGTDEGERSVWVFYESLRSGFLRAQPAPGEMVAIRYEGELPVKSQTQGRKATFHSYKVAVDRPMQAASVDWGAALGAPEPATEPDESSDGAN